MKKRSLLLVVLVAALAITAVGKAIAADNSSPNNLTTLSNYDVPVITGNVVEISSSGSPNGGAAVNDELNSLPVSNDPEGAKQTIPETEQEILQELIRYKELADSYAMQPGWTLVKFDQADLLPMNSPKPLPSTYQKEFWSHFDQNQKVFEQVDYAISPEIGRVPLGVFTNGELVSLWNDGQKMEKEPYTPSYDLYLVSSIQYLMESKISHQLSFKQEMLSDRSTSLIELQTQFSEADKKLFNIQLSKPVWGQFEKFYFDPQTGLLLRYEHSYILEDMSLVPSSITDNFEYIPNSEPPSDVVDLLAKGGN